MIYLLIFFMFSNLAASEISNEKAMIKKVKKVKFADQRKESYLTPFAKLLADTKAREEKEKRIRVQKLQEGCSCVVQ